MERVHVCMFEDKRGGEGEESRGGLRKRLKGGNSHRLDSHSCNFWSKLRTALSGLTVDHADFSAGDP